MNSSQTAMRLARIGRPRVISRSTTRCFANGARLGSSAPAPASTTESESATDGLSPRWLSELRADIKQGQSSGPGTVKYSNACRVKQILNRDWLKLLAGSEGYLLASRKGLHGHRIVWGDMDSMVSHVNNVVYNRFAESSRVNWTLNFARDHKHGSNEKWRKLMSPRGTGLILKSIRTDFKLPIVFPDIVTVLHKLVSKPDPDSSSFLLEAVIFSHQHMRPAARCFEDIVVYDYQSGNKAPLPPFMVSEFADVYEQQSKMKEDTLQLIKEMQRALQEEKPIDL